MIEETPDGYEVNCNYCSYGDTIEAESWTEMIAEIKAEGWRIHKERGEWLHECPACAMDNS